ncbi:MBOAT family O-acyltransferase [Parvicella tangerina]|uniref:Peptidoglycan O-acetyltransferase n=1 Tax=Parvicella tangerina TaxID=2829795 RepID=A0A916JJ47_9FLAO|nr:MBOAT family O-acyltransferase [Parvicella tangerina]CAG5077005.1 Peptidoglycan O-acetyltransferase [Parvicella tangerina]
MVFSSIVFLMYFLPAFLGVYLITPKAFKNYVILLFSILFYSWGAPKFVFVILGSTIIDFYIVKGMHRANEKKKKKLLLSASLIMNLGLLAYFKYANFFVENVNAVLLELGFSSVSWTEVALPIGISFYTFQTLTYAIDVYRGTDKPLEKVTDYLLYILSFPQMIAGPIVRYKDVAKQITNRPDEIDDKLIGLYRFVIGLSKKVLIANVMAEQAEVIFASDYTQLTWANAWLGTIAFTFQIYFDFSGYSDMAIGLGKMMGFKFPENFDAPYTSKNITEFWRRWHITLGKFMRDYLYIPLGGNKVSTSRLYVNLITVFLLSGLWHGASWNFVIWGGFHGFFLILDRLFLEKFTKKIGDVLAIILTFFITMIGWVIFKIENIDQLWIYLQKLFMYDGIWEWSEIHSFYLTLIIACICSFAYPFKIGKKLEHYFFQKNSYFLKEHFIFSTVSVLLFILCLSFITSSGFNPFIYFRF